MVIDHFDELQDSDSIRAQTSKGEQIHSVSFF